MEKQLQNDEVQFLTTWALCKGREGCHDSLSLKKSLAITLYNLKDKDSMKMTANAFGIARCTVESVEEICTLINENILI